jgi:hypothetical protein
MVDLGSILTAFRVISSGHAAIELTKETIQQCNPEYGGGLQ